MSPRGGEGRWSPPGDRGLPADGTVKEYGRGARAGSLAASRRSTGSGRTRFHPPGARSGKPGARSGTAGVGHLTIRTPRSGTQSLIGVGVLRGFESGLARPHA